LARQIALPGRKNHGAQFVDCCSRCARLRAADAAFAEDTVKVGFILPMTGQQQSTGKQEAAAIKLYMAQHGDTVAGTRSSPASA
jgi:ABC-type branched-subunit amino acid transport system substrate-binding protein